MTKAELLKAIEPFEDEIGIYLWCNGDRHHLDTVVHEIAEDGDWRLMMQPGPAVSGISAPRQATVLFGRKGE
jgi:hypothetical protein